MSEDIDKPTSSQIDRLNEKNYRSWSTQVSAVLRHQRVLDVVDGTTPKPILTPAVVQQPTKDETEAHKKLIFGKQRLREHVRLCCPLFRGD